MNNLWFVKFDGKGSDRIVFLVTLPQEAEEDQAYAAGFALIADFCRDNYRPAVAEIVCATPDTVTQFEPC